MASEKNGVIYRSADAKELTALQKLYVDAHFEHGGKTVEIAKAIGRTVEHASGMRKSPRIQKAIAFRQTDFARGIKMPEFSVTRGERIELLWNLAQEGVRKIYDKEGNEVMMAPATAVSAVRTINDMVAGSLAPKEIEVTVKDDTRSEQEIRDNIAKLTAEYNSLAVIEGVTETDISETRALPDIKS